MRNGFKRIKGKGQKMKKKIINKISCFLMVVLFLCYAILKPIHYVVCAIFNLIERHMDALMDKVFDDE